MTGIHSGKPGSEAVVDPNRRLMSAIIVQAVKDLGSDNPLLSIDALCYWLDERCGAFWLSTVEDDYLTDPVQIFILAIGGSQNGQTKTNYAGRGVAKRTGKNERSTGVTIQDRSNSRAPGVCEIDRATSAAPIPVGG